MKVQIFLIVLISLLAGCFSNGEDSYKKAVEKIELGKKEEGANDLLKFAKEYPDSQYVAKALLLSGETYLWTIKKENKAIAILKRVITYYPGTGESVSALLDIADFFIIKGNYNNSINLLRKALKFTSNKEQTKLIKYKLIKSYYFLNDNCLAIKELQNFKEKYANFRTKSLLIMEGELYIRCSKIENAVKVYKQLVNSDNKKWQEEGLLRVANLYFSTGEYRKAITEYYKLKEYPKSKEVADKKIKLLKEIIHKKHKVK